MKPDCLSAYKANLMNGHSVVGMWCPICGDHATDGHHVVQKGMGGTSKEFERRIPIVKLCHRCHMDVHARRMHIQWARGRWLWFRSSTPMRDDEAWEQYSSHYSPMVEPEECVTFGRRS